jgi:hypothetical protein
MGSDIEKECQDCCNFNCSEEQELMKSKAPVLSASEISNGISLKKKPSANDITFNHNNPYSASLIITNPKIYERMLKNERLHQIIEPLTSFTNKNLFEIVYQLLMKVVELQRNSNKQNSVYILFENIYKELVNGKIIDNMSKANLGYFTKIKYNLLYIIEIIAEIYHYFGYQISQGREPYNIYYWEYIKDPSTYMKEKIIDLKKSIEDINNFITDNKLKNLNKSIDIHITSTNFNITMEQ